MRPVVAEAVAVSAAHGYNFWAHVRIADYVLIFPECVLIAWEEDETALYIWLALGEGYLPKLMRLIPPHIRTLRWRRGLRLAESAPVVQVSVQRFNNLIASCPSEADPNSRRRKH